MEKERIFIVHGHDEASKEALARVIEKGGFEAIILNEQLNKSKTIIEKLEQYTDVIHAFIIYTACDEGAKRGGILESRARQNVIFEHGFLMGKLGRENTTVLYEDGIVEPSDINGLGYTELDANNAWKYEVEKILNSIKKNVGRKILKKELENEREQNKISAIKRELENLDYYEKANLREFRGHGKRTIKMPIDDPTVSGLLARRILYQTSTTGKLVSSVGQMFNCSINPEFEKYMNDKILGFPMTENELLNNRPKWAYRYEAMLSAYPDIYEPG
ncbi:MAG: nucleotide-binding protein [Fibromonadaceae bacterium]|jgi:hypothetical protein|nr:nucleotide-binding protein [Fibromonadaceae bacterium]